MTSEHDIKIVADLIFNYLRIARVDRDKDVSILRLLFDLPQVFEVDHEALAAVAISDAVLFQRVPELMNPEIYGRFAAYIEELFPAGRQESLSGEEVTRGREVLEELSRKRKIWDFDDDQRA